MADDAKRGSRLGASFAVGHVAIAAASRLVAVASVSVYLRLLDSDEYATYAVALLNEQVLFILSGYALANAMGKFMADAYAGREDEDAVIGTALVASIAIGVIAGLLWQVIAAPIAHLVLTDTSEAVTVNRLVGLSMASGLVLNVVTSIWLVRGNVVPFGFAIVGQTVGAMGIGIFCVAGLDLNAVGAMLGWAVGTTIAATGATIWVIRSFKLRFMRGTLRSMLAYGLPLLPGAIAMIALQTADRYAVRAGTNLHETAIYTTVVLVASGLSAVIVTAFKRVWVAHMWQAREQPGEEDLHRRTLLWYAAGQSVLVMLMCIYGDIAMLILAGDKSDFIEAGPAIALVYSGFVLFGAYDVLSAGYFFVGRTSLYSWSAAIALVVMIAAAVSLVAALGYWGAAIANVIAWTVFAFLSWLFGRRYFRVQHEWGRIAATVAIVGGLAALGLLARREGGIPGEFLAVGTVIAGAAVAAWLGRFPIDRLRGRIGGGTAPIEGTVQGR